MIDRAIMAMQLIPGILKENRCRECGDVPLVITSTETLQVIAEKHVSLCRFGDYEFDLILGKGVAYQDADPLLSTRLRELLSGEVRNDICRVGIPRALASFEGLTRRSQRWWKRYCAIRRDAITPLLADMEYCDAQVSRFFINRQDKAESRRLLNLWKSLWEGRRVLVVEGEKTRFGAGNDLFDNAASVGRILCPAENAYSVYRQIKEAVLRYSSSYDLVLLALGPTATVLAYDLADRGIWAIDSGNLDMEYEWFTRNASKPEKIDVKYSIEAQGGSENIGCLQDDAYKEQIICSIEATLP